MKLAWICYRFGEAKRYLVFDEPDKFVFYKVIPIVYVEIENQ